MTSIRSLPIILAPVLALTASFHLTQPAAAQTGCGVALITASPVTGSWASDCLSPNRPVSDEGRGPGDYYARFYSLRVTETAEITITLESETTDTYLYLFTEQGEYVDENDDIDYDAGNLNSRITRTLEPNDYTIEATTYYAEEDGDFTLIIDGIDFADQQDRAALVALYNATDGDNWTNNENWLTDSPISDWHGVDTDDNGRVTRLNFEGNNLTGQIPTEFGDLVMLDWVNISINRLSGELPQSLTGLIRMEYLYFDTNAGLCAPADTAFQTWLQSVEYRGRTCGAPPPGSDEAALIALYNATNGYNWRRSDNWLTDAPLSEWHGIKTDDGRVTEIYLVDNNLTGTIPRELEDLSQLKWLFLSRNNLSGPIPQELGNLSNVKILMLSNNELTGNIPVRLGDMTALEELWLGRNELSGRIPASLGRLENLRGLYLTVNDLNGEIPDELGDLSNLRTLSIAANDLSGEIPYQITDLENLTHIYLWGNSLSEGAFIRYLDDLDNLQFLDIGGNRIDGAQVLAKVDDLDRLTGLGLHDSGLADADLAEYMDDLQALDLEFLNLRGNDLSDPRILVGLSRITTIQRFAINDNDFSGQLPRSMTDLTLMRIFYFNDNRGLCAPADAEFQNWLTNIRNFRGPTCGASSGATETSAASNDAFGRAISEEHSLSLLESIQPGG